MGKYRQRVLHLRQLTWRAVFILVVANPAFAAPNDPLDNDAQEHLRQQERERQLRGQQEIRPDERKPELAATPPVLEYPDKESPCFSISSIQLIGDAAPEFQFALTEVTKGKHKAIGRCLGAEGLNVAMSHMQNAVIAKGFVTTRILAAPQDLKTGHLVLTVIPGRVRQVRFTEDSSTRANKWNAVPIQSGDILNLRNIEMGLENLKRAPTAEADIQIEPANDNNAIPVKGMSAKCPPQCGDLGAKPGESDIVIRYRQRIPFRVSVSADDGGFDSTGKYQGGVTLSGDNLLALNDLFYVNYNHDLGGGDSGGLGSKGTAAHYSVPYGYWLVGFNTSNYDYHQQVAGSTQSYVYSGRSQNSDVKLSYMAYRDAINKTIVSVRHFTLR